MCEFPANLRLSLFGPQEHPRLDDIRRIVPDETTPLEALALIGRWQQELAEEAQPKPR